MKTQALVFALIAFASGLLLHKKQAPAGHAHFGSYLPKHETPKKKPASFSNFINTKPKAE